MKWATAAATGADLPETLDRALEACARDLAGARADLIFAFVSHEHAARADLVPARVRAAFPDGLLVGCTANGVIGGGREHERTPAVALLAGHLPGVEARAVHVEDGDLPDPDAPPSAWHALLGVPPSASPAFVLMCDPFSLRAEALTGGLDYAYAGATKVGGLASGAERAGEQVLFAGKKVARAGAVVTTLAGDLRLVPAVAQGCRPVGPIARVTACEANLLRELDGVPALQAVREILRRAPEGDRALARTTLSIGVETDPFAFGGGDSADAEAETWLVRNILGIDAKDGGIYVGDALRPGRRVRLHVRDRATSAEDLERTLLAAADGAGARPAAALLFSCSGRGMNLYGVPDHDTRAFHARFGSGVPVGGFFCNGEIGPVGGATHLHGFTSAFGLIRPAREPQA